MINGFEPQRVPEQTRSVAISAVWWFLQQHVIYSRTMLRRRGFRRLLYSIDVSMLRFRRAAAFDMLSFSICSLIQRIILNSRSAVFHWFEYTHAAASLRSNAHAPRCHFISANDFPEGITWAMGRAVGCCLRSARCLDDSFRDMRIFAHYINAISIIRNFQRVSQQC